MNLTEAFKALNALNEDTFSVSDDGINKLSKFEQNDDLIDEISVIDMDAEDESELQDSYIGKVILDCSVCHSKLYKDKSEVTVDDEEALANIGEECPYCYTSDGFKVIGEVTTYNDEPTEDEVLLDESFNSKREGLFGAVKGAIGGALKGAGNGLMGEDLYDDEVNELFDVKANVDASGSSVGFLGGKSGDTSTERGDYDTNGSQDDLSFDKNTTTNRTDVNELFDVKANVDASGSSVGFLGGTAGNTSNKRGDYNTNGSQDAMSQDLNNTVSKNTLTSKSSNNDIYGESVATLDRPMSRMSGTLGNVLTKHSSELSSVRTREDALELLDYIEPEVTNKGYLNRLRDQILQIPERKVTELLYNVILKGDGMGVNEGIFDRNKNKTPQTIRGYDPKNSRYSKMIARELQSQFGGQIKTVNFGKGDETLWVDTDGKAKAANKYIRKKYPDGSFSFDEYRYVNEGIFDRNKNKTPQTIRGYEKGDPSYSANIAKELKSNFGGEIKTVNFGNGNETLWVDTDNKFKAAKRYIDKKYSDGSFSFDEYRYIKESLIEDINDIQVNTDDSTLNISKDDNGSLTVTTSPMNNGTTDAMDQEVIGPVSDETETEIKNNDNEEPVEGEEVDVPVEEFDEESFDELGESYLRSIYENVLSYKTKTVSSLDNGNKLKVEGIIRFKSGSSRPTQFIFESHNITKTGKAMFIGENVNITRGKKAFNIKGTVHRGKFITESFNYNYKTKDNTGKSTRVYGTLRTAKKG